MVRIMDTPIYIPYTLSVGDQKHTTLNTDRTGVSRSETHIQTQRNQRTVAGQKYTLTQRTQVLIVQKYKHKYVSWTVYNAAMC
jgi:hypothetical protein